MKLDFPMKAIVSVPSLYLYLSRRWWHFCVSTSVMFAAARHGHTSGKHVRRDIVSHPLSTLFIFQKYAYECVDLFIKERAEQRK